MEVKTAEHAGYCYGVSRALSAVYASGAENLCTLGPLIHNRAVVSDLESRGVRLINELSDVPEGANATVVIRSHGVPPSVYDELKARGIGFLDCTCPHVRKIHHIIKKSLTFDRKIIIIGDMRHPEIIGLNGNAGNAAVIIPDIGAANALDIGSVFENYAANAHKGCDLVVQTTFIRELFDEITGVLKLKCAAAGIDLNIYDTICSATALRQRDAAELSAWADIMVVLGDESSSNTSKLVRICAERCPKTYLCNSIRDFKLTDVLINSKIINAKIGITAGASTPPDIIKEAFHKMNELEGMAMEENSELMQAEQTQADQVWSDDFQPDQVQPEQVQPDQAAPEQLQADQDVQPEQDVQPDQVLQAEQDVQAEPAQEQSDQSDQPNPDQAKPDQARPKSFEDMLNESFVALHTGDVVKGTVISINNGEVSVNLGYKSDGIISKGEFSDDPNVDPAAVVKPGDKIDVFVIRVNDGDGNVLLSKKKLDSQKGFKEIEEAFENKTPIKGKITEIVKGGAIANVNGYRVFVPLSQLSNRFVGDVESMKGKQYNFEILEFERGKRRIVAGRKAIAAREEKANKERLFSTLEVGQKVDGVVSRIANFGAFVDLGGIDGLIHISELSWGRVKHVKDVVSEGDKVVATVIALDPAKDKISLSLRDAANDPWRNVEDRYPVGSIVQGKVVRMTTFGAFIELETGLDGLVHISQIADKHVLKPSDELKIGQVINVKVTNIDRANGRISLSKREADSFLAGPDFDIPEDEAARDDYTQDDYYEEAAGPYSPEPYSPESHPDGDAAQEAYGDISQAAEEMTEETAGAAEQAVQEGAGSVDWDEGIAPARTEE